MKETKVKVGAKTIGSEIKILDEKIIKKNFPNYLLVLPWHFRSEIIKREATYIKRVL